MPSNTIQLLNFQGGIKAVVHTDAWQVMVMFLSVVGDITFLMRDFTFNQFAHVIKVVVTAIGTSMIGPTEIFKRAADGGRFELFK